MGILIAGVIAIGAAVGLGAKDGYFKKGSDTTKKDTYAFERHALEENLARVKTTNREVYALDDVDPQLTEMRAQLMMKEDRLEQRISKLREKEDNLIAND